MADETLDDRLSELPDSLLLQILCLLPTEEAVTTCILSKRWQCLWTSLDTFSFSPRRFWRRNNGFPSFVDYALSHSNASKITKFEIDSWKSLKTIKLEEMEVGDAEIKNLLSGCPALETTVFNRVGGFRRLEINSLKVKSQKLEGYWVNYAGKRDRSFEICVPYLQHLELSHDFHDFKCSLVDVSSVVNAKITFDITCIKDLDNDYDQYSDSDEEDEDNCSDYHQGFKTLIQDYLQKLSRATELTFGTLFTQVGDVCR
ncbi:hypothetical protein KY290_001425 [Solanum tuberosum]|uniref:F-box domain-containing protein n=1 Tax=Solanum tuberosum TaxID=4113 RepID=A0ABQ7WM41_SOLTU|nr:hypothetical protein KY285_001332 [Solanum tuberosum]KAH0781827.1 hypothetical protein KY290_001425 [Solanum tuberosum]